MKTRDVRFMPELRFPFLKLREQHPDSMHWLARMFELVPDDLGPTADASGKCTLCGLCATNCEVSCKACLSRNRRAKHGQSPGCLQAGCFGHASLDEFDNSSLLPSGGPSPPPPPHAPQDRDVDVDDVSVVAPDDGPDDGPSDGGDDRDNAVPSSSLGPLPTHPFGPGFDPSIHESGEAPPRLDISAPSTPDEQRGLVRERSRQTTPSDAPAHKYVTLPQEKRGGVHPHELPEPSSDVVDTSPPPGSESGLPPSHGENSSSSTALCPESSDKAASSSEYAAASSAMSACNVCGLVKKNIEPWDPSYDCPAANKAKQGEINNLASNDVLDMASLDEWDAVRTKDPPIG